MAHLSLQNHMKKKIYRNLLMIISILVLLSFIYYKNYTNKPAEIKNISENENENTEIKDVEVSKSEEIAFEDAEFSKNKEILEELQNQNADIKAILKIDDTNIYYPVAHTDDNEYYLRRGIDKNYDINGTLFFDYEDDINTSENLIIYGHNMSNKNMFSDLMKYKDEEFAKSHREIKLFLNDEVRIYEVLNIYNLNLNKKYYEFNTFIESGDVENAVTYIKNLKPHIQVSISDEVLEDDKLLTLTTCTYESDNSRLLIVAREK